MSRKCKLPKDKTSDLPTLGMVLNLAEMGVRHQKLVVP